MLECYEYPSEKNYCLEFKWNILELASKKHIDMLIRPSTVKHEEEAIINIKKRIEIDKSVELAKKKGIQINNK